MGSSFWVRMHGGATHFPIALMMVSAAFDGAGLAVKNENRRRSFHTAAFYLIAVAALLSFGAVISGLALSKGMVLGNGLMARHHQFVWPAFGLLLVLAVWRLVVGDRARPNTFRLYVAAEIIGAALMATAGYWGGEMLLAP
jgi:uncharacterized membrane protein